MNAQKIKNSNYSTPVYLSQETACRGLSQSQVQTSRGRILSLYKHNIQPYSNPQLRSFLLKPSEKRWENFPHESPQQISGSRTTANVVQVERREKETIKMNINKGKEKGEVKFMSNGEENKGNTRRRQLSSLDTPINQLIRIQLQEITEENAQNK